MTEEANCTLPDGSKAKRHVSCGLRKGAEKDTTQDVYLEKQGAYARVDYQKLRPGRDSGKATSHRRHDPCQGTSSQSPQWELAKSSQKHSMEKQNWYLTLAAPQKAPTLITFVPG